jgi:NAD(P)-dependent dehydrogenase (short-subunit alcohol dehydrogenase family)
VSAGPRVVLVTGGGKGIGRAVVARFAAAGDRVIAIGRDPAALATTDAASVEVCDVTDEGQVTALFERVGPVDVLVANAGTAASARFERTTLSDWRAHLDVNATGVFLSARAALPGMRERDQGRIVVVASTAGRIGFRYSSAYVASKHAAVGLMRAIATEVAGTHVTANAVCPTFVRTEMTRRSVARIVAATARGEEEAEAELAAQSPLGRLLEPDEVAFAVSFLAAPEAGAINGQTLVLDGGGIQA